MAVATFDFSNLIIKAQDFDDINAGPDIYSEWKRQLTTAPTSLKSGAPPAFDVSVGGNDIGSGQTISPYFFLRNDLGWRVEPAAGSGELTINGNLFPFDTALASFQSDAGGGDTVLIKQVVSPQSITDAAGSAALARLVDFAQNKLITDPVTGKITLFEDDGLVVQLEGDLFEDAAGTIPYRGQGAERRNRMT